MALSSSSSQKETTVDETVAPAVGHETANTAVDEKVNPALQNPALEDKTVTKDVDVAPAVEHETIKKEHETREETVIDKERHQHHYHTTVQPLKDREVLPTEHNEEQVLTEVQEYNHDDGEDIKRDVDARNAEFQSSTEEGKTFEMTTKDETVAGEHVQHHLHETVQPVIEKGMDFLAGYEEFTTNPAA